MDDRITEFQLNNGPTQNVSLKKKPYLVLLLLFLVCIGYISVCFVKGFSTEIYFVNGLSKPYNITVNNKNYTLAPKAAQSLKVAQGTLNVEVTGTWPLITKKKFKIKTNFFSRPFVNNTFVINPDQAALIFWEKAYYSEKPEAAPDGDGKIYLNNDFYTFKNIDYIFREFPSSIEIPKNESVPKERIDFVPDIGIQSTIELIAINEGIESAVNHLKQHLQHEPQKIEYLYQLNSYLGVDKFIEYVRQGLEAKPIRINWHRLYQNNIQVSDPNYDIVAEYRALLQKDPENNVLNYLLGRVVIDNDEAEKYYLASVQGDNPCAFGYGALGYNRLACGEFDEAVDFYSKAKNLDSENPDFKHSYYTSLKFAQRYEEALQQCRSFIRESPYDSAWAYEEWELLITMNKSTEAKKQAGKWLAEAVNIFSAQWIQEERENLPISFAYLRGDREEYVRLLSDSPDPNSQFDIALHSRKPIEDKFIPSEELIIPYTYLLLYISEKQYGSEQRAEMFLEKAVNMIKQSLGYEEKLLADYFSGKVNLDPNEVCNMAIEPDTKKIFLFAAGLKYPEHRNVYFQFADNLNRNRMFSYLFLKTVYQDAMTESWK